jgi:type I restriction enzyme, S subunit
MRKQDLTPKLVALSERWPIVRVDDLFAIQQGKQVSKKNRAGTNQRPFLRTRNVFWGRLDLADLDEMHFTKADEERLALRAGDLLLCEGGSVGRTAIWRGEVEGCYYQNHLHRLRRTDGRVLPEFALHWFWYAFEYGHVYFGRQNVTTIPNMSKSRLAELPIPLPALDEQERIAAVLSAVLRLIEHRESQVHLATELKNALTHKIMSAQVCVSEIALDGSDLDSYLSELGDSE